MAYGKSNGHVTITCHMTPKGQTRDPNMLTVENSWRCNKAAIACSLLWGTKVGYLSDSLMLVLFL